MECKLSSNYFSTQILLLWSIACRFWEKKSRSKSEIIREFVVILMRLT